MTIRTLTFAVVWVGAGASAFADVTYTVQRGDNLFKISRKLGVSHLALVEANNLADPDLLLPGQVLKVPGQAPAPSCADSEGKHVVQDGETGLEIAKEHQLTAAELFVLNPSVEWEALPVGAQVVVEREPEEPAKPEAPKQLEPLKELVYTAKKGDSLYRIAKRLGVDADHLRKLNAEIKWERLQVGQLVKYGAQQQVARIDGGATLLREGASAGSRVLAELFNGSQVKVLRSENDWAKVSVTDHGIGWVPLNLVKAESKSNAVAPAAPAPVAKSASSGTRVDELLENAYAFKGVRYRWGGTSRSGFDCSGFTSYVFARMGVALPRTSIEQSRTGDKVERGKLEAGDLVFFRTGRSVRVNHVGIYVGENKFIHASSGGGRVLVSSLGESYYSKRFAGARRVSQFAKK